MKLLLIIALFVTVNGMAQDGDYLRLWNEVYVPECNQIVNDTLTEHGTVNYDISPKDGELKLIPIDTVWMEIICGEYKEYYNQFGGGGSSRIFLSDYSGTVTLADIGGYSTYIESSEKETFTTDISRQKVCKCKLRMPDRDHYWEWLKDNGHRK